MTPLGLRRKIRNLRDKPPITTSLERSLLGRSILKSNVWYSSQKKEHWMGWLSEYSGPGYYGRQFSNRNAEFCYNHVNCSPMALWLGEACGVSKKLVEEAKRMALKKDRMGPQCAEIRKVIPWDLVESCLRKKVRDK